MLSGEDHKICAMVWTVNVRQIRNDFHKLTFLQKNEGTNLTLLLVDFFCLFF